MAATHYIFVDFENVQDVDLSLIAGKPVKVVLVVGKHQTKVPLTLVKRLMEFSGQVRLIESEVKGRNALDFVLASEVGAQSVTDPQGSIHILSRDAGFDALIRHLSAGGWQAARHESFARIPVLATAKSPAKPPAAAPPKNPAPAAKTRSRKPSVPTVDQRVALLKERFVRMPANRPKKKKSLLALICDLFGKDLTAAQLEATVEKLVEAGLLKISPHDTVVYTT